MMMTLPEMFLKEDLETVSITAWPNDSRQVVEDGITHWYRETHSFCSLNALDISIRTNTELLVKRGDLLLNVLRKYTPVANRQVNRILDIGCGFGTIGLYVFEHLKAMEMLGIDMDPICIDTCTRLKDQLGWQGVDYQIDSMVTLQKPEGSYDLLLSNNSFCYLKNTNDVRQAIDSFYRKLSPGGTMILYAPNKWHLKEAFTKLNGVQFLPEGIANTYTRFRGVFESYDGTRLLSPVEMIRWFKAAGFSEVKLINPYRGTTDEGWERYFKPYYAFVAIK